MVLAHGFTQTGRLWGEFGAILGKRRRLVAVDLPGHGASSNVVADLVEGATLLAQAVPVERFDLLGYSLGARFALHCALANPKKVRRLVLIGATAGIEDDGAREARRLVDEERAAELDHARDVSAFISRWLQMPMFAGLDPEHAGAAERLKNTPSGLASSLRLAGVGTQAPLWTELARLAMPVLVVAGERDLPYTELGSRIAAGVPDGHFAVVPGAGHAAHLEAPAASAQVVERWLLRTSPRTRPNP